MNKQTKQTAVEWLFTMLNNPKSDQEFAKKLLDKAKEMEKDQIIDAWKYGHNSFFSINAEKYYKENFKNK